MKRRTIGILGGLGPETTAEFYLELVRLATTATRPAVCIWSLPLNLRKESEYIREGQHREYYFSLLRRGVEALVRAGSEKMVIPCNTVHEFHPRLSATIGIPITNLIEVVAQEVSNRGWNQVFLMATSRTVQTCLYQMALQHFGVNVITPSPADQRKLDRLIQGLLGDQTKGNHQKFLERMVSNSPTQNIVLGCTDLQLLFPASKSVVDSMHVLAVQTAQQTTGRES